MPIVRPTLFPERSVITTAIPAASTIVSIDRTCNTKGGSLVRINTFVMG